MVCNNDHRFLVREELARAGLEPQAVMLEPIARNTAAAVAAAALFAVRQDADAILLVMPSDHVIADTVGFLEDVRQAAQIAATGRLVLFGVKADEPHTGYGYIRQGAALNGANGGFAVDEFREKPDRAKAEGYLAAGGYFWNSGIFVLSARAYLAELERLDPAIYKAARERASRCNPGHGFPAAGSNGIRRLSQHLDRLRGDGEDEGRRHAASRRRLERRRLVVVVMGDRAARRARQRGRGRRRADRHHRTRFCAASARSSPPSGSTDLVIVDTPDALLVADKSRSQEVSAIVAKLKQSNRKEHEQHLRNYRPVGLLRDA